VIVLHQCNDQQVRSSVGKFTARLVQPRCHLPSDMDIVKKLNPFKRFHHQTSAAPSSLFDADVGSTAGGPGSAALSSAGGLGGGIRLQFHRQPQPQQPSTEPALQRLLHQRRDNERKRDARAAATEKELLHLNQKIVRKQNAP
jgi:hypothetical protein